MGKIGRFSGHLEEALIAILLALMTLVTFSQVVARYVFNSGVTWAMEFTTFCFAWLVLLGMSYGVKVRAHIGVDVVVKKLLPPLRRLAGLVGAGLCVTYALILLTGAWTYWLTMYRVGIEAQDMPVPLWIPLSVLPFSLALLAFRFVQLFWRIASGRQDGLELMDETAANVRLLGNGTGKMV